MSKTLLKYPCIITYSKQELKKNVFFSLKSNQKQVAFFLPRLFYPESWIKLTLFVGNAQGLQEQPVTGY